MFLTRSVANGRVKRVAAFPRQWLNAPPDERMLMPIDATLPYDDSNIFARILRGEIPCAKVYEDEHALAFNDINPQAPHHVLVIPKGAYVSWDDFSSRAPDAEIAGFVRAVGHIAREAGLVEPGYRLLANVGSNSGQEVPHLHVHVFGGKALGPMLSR
jgi:histidine triad (HIT) family protein